MVWGSAARRVRLALVMVSLVAGMVAPAAAAGPVLGSAWAPGRTRPPAIVFSPAVRRHFRRLLASPVGRTLSGSSRSMIQYVLSGGIPPSGEAAPVHPGSALPGALALAAAGSDIRVNDPTGDAPGDPNMTTQSEATVAVSGSNVVVAFNDDGRFSQSGAGSAAVGYAQSSNGGATFTDHILAEPPRSIAFGDPTLAADRSGHVYLASLSLDESTGETPIVVYRSNDGGVTFPTVVPLPSAGRGAFADKEWLTVGPDPQNPGHDIIYAAWTSAGRRGEELVVSRSYDGALTWSKPVVIAGSRFIQRKNGYKVFYPTGVGLATDPVSGALYAAWEVFGFAANRRTAYDLPNHPIMTTSSTDGGRTFSGRQQIGTARAIGEVIGFGDAMNFGPSNYARVTNFPSVGVGPGGRVFVAYDGATADGTSAVTVASAAGGNGPWQRVLLQTPSDAFMPALAADGSGVSVSYYLRTGPETLTAALATSNDGTTFSSQPLATTDFAVPSTIPSFDPFTAPSYMGDYNGLVRTGSATYAAWGDNRDLVVNGFWPAGRPDPNVYFRKV